MQMEVQSGQKKKMPGKDLSKFTFDFSSSGSDDDESPQISRRGNSTKI